MQKNTIEHRIENIETTATDHAPDDPGDIVEMFSRLTPENKKLVNQRIALLISLQS